MSEQNFHNLLASLPHLPSPFASGRSNQAALRQALLPRQALETRLSALDFDHRRQLDEIEILMHWDREEKQQLPDEALIRKSHQVRDQLQSPLLQALINWRLDMRTVVAALRLKRAGEKAPAQPKWSFGQRYEFIRRNWTAPYFNLQFTFPWLPTVARCMEENSSLELEQTLLEAVWQQLDRVGRDQRFSFEAVVIYVLRWNLAHRWVSYDSEQAITRFDTLVDNALGESLESIAAYA